MGDSTVDQQGVQVELESSGLQHTADAVAADPEAMLDLGPPHVAAAEDTALGQPLAEQPLGADEG